MIRVKYVYLRVFMKDFSLKSVAVTGILDKTPDVDL